MASASANRRYELNAIQALRAFAAGLVVTGHLLGEAEQVYKVNYDFTGFPWGCGVDLFFVISGFVMVYTSSSGASSPGFWKVFATKRLIRIVPLYYVFTSLKVPVLILFPHLFNTAKFDIWQIVSSYLFWPYARSDGHIRPVLSLGWTLNYEMFFYFLFALFLFFRTRFCFQAIIFCLVVLSLFGALVDADSTEIRFWTNSIILEFAFGMLVGLFFLKFGKVALSGPMLTVTIVASIFSFFLLRAISAEVVSLPRFIVWGVPAGLLVFVGAVLVPVGLDKKVPLIVRALGDSSYALYLSHPFVFGVVGFVWHRLGLTSPIFGWPFIAVTFLACCVCSVLVHLWFERPLLATMRGRWLEAKQA